MKSGIALTIFVVLLAVAGQTVAAMSCDAHVGGHDPAGAPPAVTAMIGLVLFATGAVTRRSTTECA